MKKSQIYMIILGIVFIATVITGINSPWLYADQEIIEGPPIPFSMTECQRELNATFQWQILNDSFYFTQVSLLNCASTMGNLNLQMVQKGEVLYLYEIQDLTSIAMCDCKFKINGTVTGFEFENKVLKVIYAINNVSTTLFEVNLI